MSANRIPPKKAKAKAASLPPAIKQKAKTTLFTQVADRLDDTAILLHGLHRRHKNQHRVSTYWWPAFGQLRRAVGRLLEDVQKSDERNGTKSITLRVGETRVLVPKVYLAFSRLVADKQFAPLGLLLVGVLAQVQASIQDIEGILGIAEADAGDDADGTATAKASKAAVTSTSTFASTPKISSSSTKKTADSPEVDFGVAISRDSRVEGDKPAKSASSSSSKPKKRARKDDSEEDVPKLAASPALATAESKTTKMDAKSHPEKKRKITLHERTQDDEGVVETAKEAPTVGDEHDQERKEKKQIKETKEKKYKKEKKDGKDKDKKKKRKRGDEFDDLFSGLM